MQGGILHRIAKISAFVFSGFAGGALTPWILGWIRSVSVATPSDAYAIANTYIVFTTIIFVGITVLLAIAGYVITQHFSTAKATQEHQIIDELKERVKVDEGLGIKLANAMLENPDVTEHLKSVLNEKVKQLINDRLADSQGALAQAQAQERALNGLAAQLNGGGGE
ncbi:hypothetical protein [Pseudomonas sp. PIC25]|uniref:hypothetical protein n=1 Tax=Pseudomonas sp. PIC25 TaxID=1958773 RepID=UPI001179DF94|nr:hypothetical protein [Pseudomonas sp. PIC25]